MSALDPRNLLARADLADADLQGLVKADRFDKAQPMHCVAAAAAVRREPDASAEQLDQLLFGETFRVLETGRGWGWGQAVRDGYVGHVQLADLRPGVIAATHRVSALRAYAFSRPDIKNDPDNWAQAGSVTAALFLKRFAPESGAWVHLDIFAWNPKGRPGFAPGAEAQGIRALLRVLRKRFA